MMKQIIFVALLIVAAQAEIFNRPCRTIAEYGGVKIPFDPAAFLGRWFEIERYEQPFQRGLDCVVAEYSLNPDGSIKVDNRAQSLETLEKSTDVGRAVIAFPDEDPLQGKLNVTFGSGEDGARANYWILDTDYRDFAVVVSCANLPTNRSFESYWYLSRSVKPTANGRARVDEIKRRVIDPTRVRPTTHNSLCWHGAAFRAYRTDQRQ